MKENLNVVNESGFYFNKNTQMVEWFEIKSITVDFRTDTVTYNGLLGGVSTTITDNNIALYGTLTAYEGGGSRTSHGWLGKFSELFTRAHKTRITRNDDGVACAWVMVDNEAKLVEIEPMVFTIDIERQYNYNIKSDSTKKYYSSKTDVFDYNDYYVKDDNGKVTKRISTASLVALNDKQKELADKMDALLKEMNEAKMKILFSRDEWMLYAMSMENIQSLETYDDYNDDYTQINMDMCRQFKGVQVSESEPTCYGLHATFKEGSISKQV